MESKAQNRIERLAQHLATGSTTPALVATPTAAASKKSPDDVVIVSAVRTPIAKAKRGGFKDTTIDVLIKAVVEHTLKNNKVDPALIGDFVVGTVLPRGAQSATEVRIGGLLAGLPQEVPVMTLNRQCSSGLQAVANVAAAIKSGQYDIGLAGGVESMSLNSMGWDGGINEEAMAHPTASGCYQSMGQTSENVAERYGITRKEQDEFAVESHKRAAAAQAAGKFKSQIVPVTVKTEDGKEVVVSVDEGIRGETTFAGLSKLKPAFKEGGSTTAGNSSQLSDGAAVVLLARRSTAEKLKLNILGTFRAFSAVGVEPSIMGVGPAFAIPDVLKRAGLSTKDVDVYEINEAFASQASFCINKLGLDKAKVNPNGGAIALGHPLGCTGARMVADILPELKRQNGRYGVISMCIGSGMGAAAVIERE